MRRKRFPMLLKICFLTLEKTLMHSKCIHKNSHGISFCNIYTARKQLLTIFLKQINPDIRSDTFWKLNVIYTNYLTALLER